MADRLVQITDGAPYPYRLRETAAGVYALEVVVAPALNGGADSASNVLGGSVAIPSGTASALLLTIPVGRTWKGTVNVSGSAAGATGATAATTPSADLVLAGVGATPAAGVLCGVSVALPAALAAAVTGASGRDDVTLPVVIVAGGAPVTLTLTQGATPMTVVRATARGALL